MTRRARPQLTAPGPAARDRAIHDATVSTVAASSPPASPAIRRSQAPSSIPASTPARISARSASGTNPRRRRLHRPGRHPRPRAALTGHAPAAGNPASPRSRSCQLCWGRDEPPCGVPSSRRTIVPSSNTPAFSHFMTSRRTLSSAIRCRRNLHQPSPVEMVEGNPDSLRALMTLSPRCGCGREACCLGGGR